MMLFWRLEPDKNTRRTLNFGSLTTIDLGIPEEFQDYLRYPGYLKNKKKKDSAFAIYIKHLSFFY